MVAVLFIPHIYKNGNTFFPSTKLFSVAAPAEMRRRSLERGRLLPNTHSKGALVRKGRYFGRRAQNRVITVPSPFQ